MSKFKNLMAQARQREFQPDDEDDVTTQEATQEAATQEQEPATSPKESPSSTVATPEDAVPAPLPTRSVDTGASATQTNDAAASRGRGRPSGPAGGKRSDPDYEQVSAYLPRQTYREVKLALLQNEVTTGAKQEFSSLVAELLSGWLRKQKTG